MGTLALPANGVSVNENARELRLPVTRTDGSDGIVSVDYYLVSITATPGTDYVETSGTLTFNEGQTTQDIVINILDDTIAEESESFVVYLTNPQGGASLGMPSSTSITVSDDDSVVIPPDPISTPTSLFSVLAKASPSSKGSVSGAGTYTKGKSITVKAKAKKGKKFVNWTENGKKVSSNANYKFTVNRARSLVAHFK